MNAVATVVRKDPTQLDVFKGHITRRAEEFKAVLPSHITVDKFQRTLVTAALSNPKLFECDRQSLLMAANKCAMDGLLPDGREAALIPFKTRIKNDQGRYDDHWIVQYMPMAWGLRKKVLQSGEVVSLQVGVVYAAEVESGNFVYEIGMEPPIRHRPKLDMTDAEMADDQLVAAYSIGRLKNEYGEPYWSVEVMRRFEVNKVRQMSQTGALGQTVKYGSDKGKPIPPKGPWVDWEPEMWKKTVLRRHTKVLPMSGDLLDTLERDDAEEARANAAARLLATETRTPVALPTGEELDQKINPETGEVIQRDERGMSEVDEDVARELDARTGRDDADHDDQFDGTDEQPAWRPHVDRILASIAAAQNAKGLTAVDGEFMKIRAGLPDDIIADIERAFTTRRNELAA
jgi:recombination protein RecT